MQLELVPPERVGPLIIGMDFDAAHQTLIELPGYRPPPLGRREALGFAHYESELSISVHAERGRVKAVEVFRPEERDVVVYQGLSVFDVTADQVMETVSARHALDIVDDGLFVVAPELLLAFSRTHLPERPDDEDGRYFSSVLLAAPGYYLGPDGNAIY
ncbi:hypothetical protein D0T12_05510 [Actinomadura spongiicola]|uniref:Uncharacterized protein n=1 Tax=Actinomadura spongiicola TaxID=2303421 RepID=A0A372GLV6_9ACTN|nr:hypothetical protein [Actinomadura spongiicola]RFS86089.1 hypothetical protein D0T12_05510 [Actinomadura spongiicola]